MIFSFFACQRKNKMVSKVKIDTTFIKQRQVLDYNVGPVEFLLTKDFDTCYCWKRGSWIKYFYTYQNQKDKFFEFTQFAEYPFWDKSVWDSLYNSQVNNLTITTGIIKLYYNKSDDSIVLKTNDRINKCLNGNWGDSFKGLIVDTIIKVDNHDWSVCQYKVWNNYKNQSNMLRAFTFLGGKGITFQFENTESPDSTWFQNCMKTFESIRFMK